ncbi:MAG: hypothetical protein B7Z55_18965 [Planctomycetales bacterium 12-60-4]|nr:MAG: hypothetical protein B7Z55_18965 [Planctomycetales bacterium 12-60-4]
MRLLCQRIAQKSNKEDETPGKFWQNRYRAVRLIDEEAILACAAYVDLNPIRAGMAQTIEDSQFTSARLRLQTSVDSTESVVPEVPTQSASIQSSVEQSSPESTQTTVGFKAAIGSFLGPVEIDELNDPLGARPSASMYRCSDKGFLAMPTSAYLELLDWTARQMVNGKRGATPEDALPIFERLKIKPAVWYELVTRFGKLFSLVAGQPHRVDEFRGRLRKNRYHLRQAARELLSV